MHLFKFLKENFIQIFKFGIVGIFNTCNSLLFYYLFLYFNINYFVANFFAYIISCFISYRINKKFVFRCNNDLNVKYKYYFIYLSSFFINMFCIYFWVDILTISSYIAPIITLFITVPYNYLFSKFWVFYEKKNNYSHTFVICAYQKCVYLEECILSLLSQSISSNILIVTSTDNNYIRNLAKKYKIKLYVRSGKSDIQADWNYAYSKAKTDLVTIVHQDDVYHPDYLKYVLQFYSNNNNVSFVSTDYLVLKNGKKNKDINGKLKKILKFPLKYSLLNKIKFFKVFSLSFGNSINCPSVTYNKLKLGNCDIFTSNLKFSLDWDTFLKFAKLNGRIGYINKELLFYRIHKEATTVKFIKNNDRYKEDVIMFEKIWPKFIVKFIMKFYIKASNTYGGFCDEK